MNKKSITSGPGHTSRSYSFVIRHHPDRRCLRPRIVPKFFPGKEGTPSYALQRGKIGSQRSSSQKFCPPRFVRKAFTVFAEIGPKGRCDGRAWWEAKIASVIEVFVEDGNRREEDSKMDMHQLTQRLQGSAEGVLPETVSNCPRKENKLQSRHTARSSALQ